MPEPIAEPGAGFPASKPPKVTGLVSGPSFPFLHSKVVNPLPGPSKQYIVSPHSKAVYRPSNTSYSPHPFPYMGWNLGQADVCYPGSIYALHGSNHPLLSLILKSEYIVNMYNVITLCACRHIEWPGSTLGLD